MIGELKAGRAAIIEDVNADPLTDTAQARDTYARMQIRSLICVPIVRSGRLIAVFVMCDSKPRRWRDDDARLLEQVAERTLFAIESARAAQALRENRDVLALAMAVGRMGAFTRDLVNDRTWWSPELARLMGFGSGDAPTRDLVYATLHKDDAAAVIKDIESGIKERRDFSTTFRFHHKATGELRWLEVDGRATYNADGTPHTVFGLGIDVTERMRAVAALQEADRRKDEFLATLAHELRNPLAPISSGLHILKSARERDQAAIALDIMERQVAQMVRLVDDLLDVARITTGKVEIRCEPLDLLEPIKDAIETSEPTFSARGQRFAVHRPQRPIYVNGDRTRLAQVFANLLNNSAKYSEPGEEISLTFEQDGSDAVIRVRDHGIGIHPEMLPRVFEMFRQADRTGGRSRGGLGIGLSLVKRIVELHGGTVTATSEGLGRGSEFIVRMPALEANVAAADRAAGVANGNLPRRRILVVDDNADAAESLAALLTISGHETRMAHDGRTAFEEARQFQPDVIFLDIGMPMLDGHETAKLIREQPWGKEIVLVALTGWGQSEDRRRSKDAGFDHHLVKPANPDVVAKLLASL
jgi:PAS domain S-box-containing protein